MQLRTMSQKALRRQIHRFFGKGVPWERREDFVFVHLDAASKKTRDERAGSFEPEHFFDPECPHCQPFLKDGAIMVYTGHDLIGMRLLEKGQVETVMLRPGALQRAVN